MKIATVTPNKPYDLVDSHGNVTHTVIPGDLLSVMGTRMDGQFEIMDVEYQGMSFGIPKRRVFICEELELV